MKQYDVIAGDEKGDHTFEETYRTRPQAFKIATEYKAAHKNEIVYVQEVNAEEILDDWLIK